MANEENSSEKKEASETFSPKMILAAAALALLALLFPVLGFLATGAFFLAKSLKKSTSSQHKDATYAELLREARAESKLQIEALERRVETLLGVNRGTSQTSVPVQTPVAVPPQAAEASQSPGKENLEALLAAKEAQLAAELATQKEFDTAVAQEISKSKDLLATVEAEDGNLAAQLETLKQEENASEMDYTELTDEEIDAQVQQIIEEVQMEDLEERIAALPDPEIEALEKRLAALPDPEMDELKNRFAALKVDGGNSSNRERPLQDRLDDINEAKILASLEKALLKNPSIPEPDQREANTEKNGSTVSNELEHRLNALNNGVGNKTSVPSGTLEDRLADLNKEKTAGVAPNFPDILTGEISENKRKEKEPKVNPNSTKETFSEKTFALLGDPIEPKTDKSKTKAAGPEQRFSEKDFAALDGSVSENKENKPLFDLSKMKVAGNKKQAIGLSTPLQRRASQGIEQSKNSAKQNTI